MKCWWWGGGIFETQKARVPELGVLEEINSTWRIRSGFE